MIYNIVALTAPVLVIAVSTALIVRLVRLTNKP